jgi:hypothetical protein
MPTDRDIRELRGDIDPRLGKILIGMNGDIHALRQMIRQLASMFDHMASMMQIHSTALAKMKENEDYAQRLKAMGMEVSSDPSVTGEIDEP